MRHNGEQQGARRPEDILAEIDRTRHEMDSTLSAIEHRVGRHEQKKGRTPMGGGEGLPMGAGPG